MPEEPFEIDFAPFRAIEDPELREAVKTVVAVAGIFHKLTASLMRGETLRGLNLSADDLDRIRLAERILQAAQDGIGLTAERLMRDVLDDDGDWDAPGAADGDRCN